MSVYGKRLLCSPHWPGVREGATSRSGLTCEMMPPPTPLPPRRRLCGSIFMHRLAWEAGGGWGSVTVFSAAR